MSSSHGRLGIVLAGLGAVSTTLIGGVAAARRGVCPVRGSLTEGRPTWRAGVVGLDDLAFAAWDIHDRDALQVARDAQALPEALIGAVAEDLAAVRPQPAAFTPGFLDGVTPTQVLPGRSEAQIAALTTQLQQMPAAMGVDRLVVVWSGSTEGWPQPTPWPDPFAAVAAGEALPGSLMYALAALRAGVPFVTLAPSGGVELPAVQRAAAERGVPIAGSDLQTGQSWLKSVLAEAIRDRLLGVDGWFSLNLLGNEDGRTLQHPDSQAQKRRTKLGALGALDAERWPELYGALQHEVRIEHFGPRGDAKEAWDTIELRGWGDRQMSLKLDLLGWDSALAAPLALDLVRLLDLAARQGRGGVQDWLGWYFKAPAEAQGGQVDPRLSWQRARLEQVVHELLG